MHSDLHMAIPSANFRLKKKFSLQDPECRYSSLSSTSGWCTPLRGKNLFSRSPGYTPSKSVPSTGKSPIILWPLESNMAHSTGFPISWTIVCPTGCCITGPYLLSSTYLVSFFASCQRILYPLDGLPLIYYPLSLNHLASAQTAWPWLLRVAP